MNINEVDTMQYNLVDTSFVLDFKGRVGNFERMGWEEPQNGLSYSWIPELTRGLQEMSVLFL